MSTYLNVNTWIWNPKEKILTIDVKQITKTFMIKLQVEHSSVEIQLTREEVVALRDKIDNALLDA